MIKTQFTTIKRQLMVLVLSGILPIFLFSVAVVSYVAFQQQKVLDTSLIGTTRALSAAIVGQLNTIESSLTLIRAVEDFENPDMREIHRKLKRYVDKQSNWSSIGISDLDGKQIFSTLKPFGEPLPGWSNQKFFQEILQKQVPVISGFRIGRISGKKNFSLAIPIKVRNVMKYVLVATVNTEYLNDILVNQKLPNAWTATILDHDGVVMARNFNHEKFSGQKASDDFLARFVDDETFFETVNKDGQKQYGTSVTLPRGWKLYLGMPLQMSALPSQNILWFLIIGGSTLLGLGVLLSTIVSGKIARPIIALAETARLIGKGGKAELVESQLSEIHEVSVALQNASIERDHSDEKAHQAIILRDNFLSVASHELKTPLTTINLQAQRLSRLVKRPAAITPEVLNHSSNAIAVQVKRLTRLIDDLLDISRITAGKLDVHKEPMDLAQLTKEVLSYFEETAGHIKLSISHDEKVHGNFDRNRMEQVITNLISNAIKYGDGKPVEVLVTASEGKAKLSVKDYGLGIDRKNHAKIFERFERLVNSNEISGLGLGLWIVHRIVVQLEGEISVSSDGLGKGSTFTVTIPLI